jgi:hypothetical protein
MNKITLSIIALTMVILNHVTKLKININLYKKTFILQNYYFFVLFLNSFLLKVQFINNEKIYGDEMNMLDESHSTNGNLGHPIRYKNHDNDKFILANKMDQPMRDNENSQESKVPLKLLFLMRDLLKARSVDGNDNVIKKQTFSSGLQGVWG